MKQNYLLLCLSLTLISGLIQAQTVNQIYDHDSTNLNQLHNMPFDESKLLVVSNFSFSPAGLEFHELDQASSQLLDLTFMDVDTILSTPEFKDDKMFFEASINGLGRELVAYDGISTYFFDFNIGSGNSNPEVIEFEDEIYVIANDGNIRQLYKYTGGTTFDQITEELTDDVDFFIANRGDEYYYITFNSTNGRKIKVTEDNNGTLTHSIIAPGSYQESLGDVVMLNGDIFMVSYIYTSFDASYRIDKIDASNMIITHHFQAGSQFSSGHLLAYDNDILFYKTEPGVAEILNITTPQQPLVQVSIDPAQYNLIGNHVVQNDKLFIYGDQYIMDVSGPTPVSIIEDGSTIRVTPAYESDSSFYLYEVAPFSTGGPSGIIEVSSVTNQLVRYTVSNDGGHFFHTSPMVVNNDELKFIFKTEDNTPSTDIYSFQSVLSSDEHELDAFELFPNPIVDGELSIVLPHAGNVHILTIEGQVIQSTVLNSGMNRIQLEDISAGVYLVQYGNQVERILIK